MLSGMTAMAQLTEGFYRVSNLGSGRYLYVRDCTGSVDMSGTDFGAIELWSGVDKTCSDPSSIIFLKQVGSSWDLQSQGTGVHQLTGHYVAISQTSDKVGYMLYDSGQYLYEIGTSDIYPDMGLLGAKTNAEMPGKAKYRIWITHPITNSGNDFFGIQPYLQKGDKHYTTFFADFAYTPIDNVRTYGISQVDTEHAIAVYKPVSGTVARQQPVIVECPTATPASNRIQLTTSAGNAVAGNQLHGIFFCNGDRTGISRTGNPAAVEFDPATMRMLALDANNQLILTNTPVNLVNQTIKKGKKWVSALCVPANQAYLPVSASCPTTLRLMTEAEYRHYIDSITPVITHDTTFAISGSLTDGVIRPLPYSTSLAIDATTSFRIAQIVRTNSTVGGQTTVVSIDTLWRGAAAGKTTLDRSYAATGFPLSGTATISLTADADGTYRFAMDGINRLSVAFPELPIPVITRDTTCHVSGSFTSGDWTPMPSCTYSIQLPIDSTVRFRFARVIRTSEKVGSRPVVITMDTTHFGASADGELISREAPSASVVHHSNLPFALTADASGRYTLSLSETTVTVTYPAPPVPGITRDTLYYIIGSFTRDQWQQMPQASYSLNLAIDSLVDIRFARVIETRTIIETRPAEYSYDTLYLGATHAGDPVLRSTPTLVITPHSIHPFSLLADADGRYTVTLNNDSVLTTQFPALPIPVITSDTTYYIQQWQGEAATQQLPCALWLDEADSFRFHVLRIIETQTTIGSRDPVITVDTLRLGATGETTITRGENNMAKINLSGTAPMHLTADISGRYEFDLLPDRVLQVAFPVIPLDLQSLILTPETSPVFYDLLGRRYTCGWDNLPAGIYLVGEKKIYKY